MVDAVRGSDGPVTAPGRGSLATLARFPTKVEEGRNVSRRGYPVTTAFSSLNPGIGGIDSVIAVGGVHKVKPCS